MKISFFLYPTLLSMLLLSSCDKYLDGTALPINSIPAGSVFETDNLASAAVTGILLSFNTSGSSFAGSAVYNLAYTTSLYTDEMKVVLSTSPVEVFYKNRIQPVNSPYWKDFYQKIFMVNSALDGLQNNEAHLKHQDQWLGECYFLRAFYYYHLVNFYGAIPIALTNDFVRNNQLFRSPEEAVYQQIVADLKQAKELLSATYKDGSAKDTQNRFRPNKAVASALLARIYLHTGDWINAEKEATEVIADANYDLVGLHEVFLAGSKETIWAIATNNPARSVYYTFFNNGMPSILNANQTPNSFGVGVYMSNLLLNAFEAGDNRLSTWVRKSTAVANATRPETVYSFPNKYASAANNTEYQVLFRLSEQYLIRAEARAQQQLPTAIDDLNAVRQRAGLGDIQPTDVLAAIAKERQTELFTEGAHRFFDLKRTGKIDEVMNEVAKVKQSTWEPYMANWPIPTTDILQNPNLSPNPGYAQ